MTWISLVCLLVLSSSAFGRSAYDSTYGASTKQQIPRLFAAMRDQAIQRQLPVAAPTYGQQQQPIFNQRFLPMMQQQDMPTIHHQFHSGHGSPLMPKALPVQGYGQSYGGMPFVPQFDQTPPPPPPPPQPIMTPADIICQNQQAETVIPLEEGRKFVVCLGDAKGVEQECPKGLLYHPTSQRCERKLGPLENPCAAQPCLNGGNCIPTDSSYKCECQPGFDGKTCELDARICQTQPCGQSPDSKCQSFRLNAALQYICIFQDGHAYGLSPQQVVPSPCQDLDGPRALAVSNNGFIMCDGERMFVESCPGGTIWDDVEKACSWPDSVGDTQLDQPQGYGQSTYGTQQRMLPQSTYGNQYTTGQQLEQPKLIHAHHMIAPKQFSSYGVQKTVPQQPDYSQSTQTYGAPPPVPQPFEQTKFIQPHHVQMIAPKQVSSYSDIPQQLDQPNQESTYGDQNLLPQQPEQIKFSQPIRQQQDNFVSMKQLSSGY